MTISILDNNSKMITSKYIYGKYFTNFVKAFKLQDYYFTTFNYIIINTFSHDYKLCISNSAIERIKKTLQLFPNLNEIVLNFVSPSNIIDYKLKVFKYYYDKFKENIKIKINIISQSYKPYKEVYVILKSEDEYIFKNIFEPNVKQKVYLMPTDINTYEDMLKFKDYNLIYELHGLAIDETEEIVNIFKNLKLNIKYGINFEYDLKLNNINDIKKYCFIQNNHILGIKTCYKNKIEYIEHFKDYYDLFKLKNTNLNYLREYITNIDGLINNIDKICYSGLQFYLYIIRMCKYGVKNIYIEGPIEYDIMYNKLCLYNYINNINAIVWLKCKKINIKAYHNYKKLFKEIENYIKY